MRRLLFWWCCVLALSGPAFAQTNLTTTSKSALLGQYWVPPCTLPDAATIAIPSSACPANTQGTSTYIVTPTATRILAFPSDLQPGQAITVIVRHPATGNAGALNLAAGWDLPGTSLTNGQPIWSSNGSEDWLVCESTPSTAPNAQNGLVMSCPSGVLQNIIPVTAPQPPQTQVTLDPNHTQNQNHVLTVSVSNSIAGHTRTVVMTGCSTPYCTTGTTIARATSIVDEAGTACVAGRNSYSSGANGVATDAWICPGVTAGNHTLMITWPGIQYPEIFVQEWANLTGTDLGVGATMMGTCGAPSIATNGSVSAGNLVLGIIDGAAGPLAPTSGTKIDGTANGLNLALYNIPGTGGPVTLAATQSSSTRCGGSIIGMK